MGGEADKGQWLLVLLCAGLEGYAAWALQP